MSRLRKALKGFYHRLPAAPSTNFLYRRFEVNPYELLPPNALVYDIGSKNARGSYAFGNPPPGSTVLCVDIEQGPSVDLVADAHDLHEISSNSADCVLCIGVLCCVRYPRRVMDELHRILKPGGIVYVNVPFIYPFCADPDDLYRFSYPGLAVVCEDFELLDSGFNRGPASTMQELFVRFFAMLFSFNGSVLYAINVELFKWMFCWIKYLDKFLARYKMAYQIYSGSYFIGRKRKSEM